MLECNKLFTEEDKKVRSNDHITGKHRDCTYSNCNNYLRLTKDVPVIIRNLNGYNRYLIMQEISNFDVEIRVIPNGLEKCVTFTIDKNLVFINIMQFVKSSLEILIRNLSGNNVKFFISKLYWWFAKISNTKRSVSTEINRQFWKVSWRQIKCKFFSSLKDECIVEKDFLHAIDVLNMNTLADYHDI